ncbi:MAG: phBC6A51 family helix-turn-helix protein [Syntrophales bacterium]
MNELTTDTNAQNRTTYQPSRAARKLLEVLLNPEHRYKSVTEVCKLAGISRDSYYRLFADQRFVCFYTSEAKKLVKAAQGPVVNAAIKSAVRGNPQNIKTVLSMAGLFKEKSGLVINPDKEGNAKPVRIQTDMELAVKLCRILFSNPKVVEHIQARLKERNGESTSQVDMTDENRP